MSGNGETTDYSLGNGNPDRMGPATSLERQGWAEYASNYFAGLRQAAARYEQLKRVAGQSYLRKLGR